MWTSSGNNITKSFEYIKENQINDDAFNVFAFFISVINTQGEIQFLNQRAKEILALDKEDLFGYNFIEHLVLEEDKQKVKKCFNELFIENSISCSAMRFHLVNFKNKRIILEAKNALIVDEQNQIKGILISGKDITDYVIHQQNLQNDIQLYRALINNIPDINIFVFDRNQRILLAEGTEMKNIGLNGEELEGKTLGEFPRIDIINLWTPLFDKVFKGEKSRVEYKIMNYSYLIRVTPMLNRNDEIIYGIAIVRNVTGEKLTKNILNKSREEAIQSEAAKSHFLANVSHEIRTPLNAIMGFTEQLLQTKLTPLQQKYVEIIDQSSEHLLSLINDILVLSKIEANQISFENKPFLIKTIIEYVYKSMKVKAEEKNLHLSYEIDEKINRVLIGDSFRLRQILINLISNAIKYTNTGSVKLICTVEKESIDNMLVKFDISDTGIGISQKDMKKIFEQYTQLGSGSAKRQDSSGLGLAICKNLVKLQNGSLSVSSQKGVGSTFSFTIPYNKGSKSDLPSPDPITLNPGKLSSKKILLVDDDKVNLLLGVTILEKYNCSFDVAKSGKEAISKLQQKRYDAVLLDIHMPGTDGLDVAYYIRKDLKDKKCKILAITAAALKDDIKKYEEAGINDFLIKPFRENDLYNKLFEVLRLKGYRASKRRTEIILKSEMSPKSYNLFDLKKMANYDESFIIQALNTFISNAKLAVVNLKHYLEEEDWIEIGETAHRILPSFKHLEVDKVIPKLIELKTKTIIDHDYYNIRELVLETIQEIQKVIEDMKKEISSLNDLYS
jgi:PAS domain S-box-containing protein